MPYRLEWSVAAPYGELHRWSPHGDARAVRAAALAAVRSPGVGALRVVGLGDGGRGDVADAVPDAATLLAWDVARDRLPRDGEGNPLLAERRAAERADAFSRDLLRLTASAARDGVIPAAAAERLRDDAAAAVGRPDPRWPRGRPA